MKKPISIFKAIKGKPSIALQHMVDGLLKQSRRKKFEVAMGTYGASAGEICYGCAATCAIQNLTKTNFSPIDIRDSGHRANITQTDMRELEMFEYAIDDARRGYLFRLFKFCDLDSELAENFSISFELHDGNWKGQLAEVRKTITKLKKAGY